MSEQKGIKWITVNGAHIPIKGGQTTEQAKQEFFAKKKAASSSGGSAKTNASPSDKTGIKQQVRDNQDKIARTKVVATIPRGKIITDYQTAATAVRVKLAKNGGVVTRKGLGDIQVGEVLKKAKKYTKTAAEIAALAAVPSVIEHGIEIASHERHKGRDFSTRTIAGRVTIDGQDGIVAVVIAETSERRYKVHRVLTPDGKMLEI